MRMYSAKRVTTVINDTSRRELKAMLAAAAAIAAAAEAVETAAAA